MFHRFSIKKKKKNVSICREIFWNATESPSKKGHATQTVNQTVPRGNTKGEWVSPDASQYGRWQGENSASTQNSGQPFSMAAPFVACSLKSEEHRFFGFHCPFISKFMFFALCKRRHEYFKITKTLHSVPVELLITHYQMMTANVS